MRVPALVPALVVALVLVLAACGPAGGAPAGAQTDATSATGAALGEVDFSTSAGPEAEAHFLRGVAALHSFWYDEAADAFRAAGAAEPGFALAAWGETMTCNHPIWNEVDLACGREALERLGPTPEARAAKAASESERGWLAAVETLFADGGDKADRDRAYERAMAELAAARPGDLEAAAFHALAIQGLVYGRAADEADRFPLLMHSAAKLEELFDRAPRHPGVLHYLIHAYDDPVHAPLGLRAARTYAEVAPAAHHALHMPSHIFVQLGLWDRAAASNEDAWAASVAWTERRGLPVAKRDFHSLGWLAYAYLQQGRLAAARETIEIAREAAAAESSPRVRHALGEMTARYRVETGEAPPGGLPEPGEHAGNAVLFALGLEALDRDPEAAGALAGRLEAMDDREGRVLAEELHGLAAIAAGDVEGGLGRLARAAELESELPPPSGPPDPVKPALELHGEALLRLGRPAEAAERFAASLARTPRRTASLLGAARAAAAAGDAEAARRHRETLAEIWAGADESFPPLAELADAGGEAAAPGR